MYKIQANIPIPPRKASGRRKKYPFQQMEVGTSFLVPKKDTNGDLERLKSRMVSASSMASKAFGFKFTLRTLPEGVRIWRVQ